MPNATFIPFINQVFREHGVFRRCIMLGEDDDLDILAEKLLLECIAEVYYIIDAPFWFTIKIKSR